MFTYRLQMKLRRDYLPRCQLCHRHLKQNKKKIIPRRRIVEAGHREKDKADLARGHEKRLSKNRKAHSDIRQKEVISGRFPITKSELARCCLRDEDPI